MESQRPPEAVTGTSPPLARGHVSPVRFGFSLCFSVQTLDGCDVLLGPEVTYGPPGLDLLGPVAMSIAHCAEVDTENWNVQLKRRTEDSKWEVRHTHTHTS